VLGVTANQVQDSFKALLQSDVICQSKITPQGVAHHSSESKSTSAVSSALGNDHVMQTTLICVISAICEMISKFFIIFLR